VIGDISDEVKARALLPVMQDLVQPLLVDQFGTWSEEYVTLIVSSFDKSSSGALNETNSGSWPIFASFLRYFFQAGVSTDNIFSSGQIIISAFQPVRMHHE
jgi:hypothetical protein